MLVLSRWVTFLLLSAAFPWWCHQMESFSMLLTLWVGIHWSLVNSPHKGSVMQTLMFRWCRSVLAVKQTVERLMIWDYMKLMWCHRNGQWCHRHTSKLKTKYLLYIISSLCECSKNITSWKVLNKFCVKYHGEIRSSIRSMLRWGKCEITWNEQPA